MGARDAHVDGDLTGRVISHRPRVVVVRPEFGVVFEIADFEDLILGFNVPMFGHADIDTHPILVGVFPIDPRILNRLIGTVGTNTASPRAASRILAGLMAAHIKIAYARKCFPKIADLIFANTTGTRQ